MSTSNYFNSSSQDGSSNKSFSKEDFVRTILVSLQELLGEEYKVLVEKVTKNNGLVLTGLIAKKQGATAYPTIYVDHFYKTDMKEREVQLIVQQLYNKICEAEVEEGIDLSDFTDFERAKCNLAFKLVHADKNKEYLKQVPHRRFHNLAIVFYYTVQEPPFCGNAVIVIKKEHMRKWRVSPEALYEAAMMNMPVKFPHMIQNIEDVMRGLLESGLKQEFLQMKNREHAEELFSDDWIEELLEQMTDSFRPEGERIPMFVLTNKQKLQGAACMLYPGVLKSFGERIGQDFYVLPSSVHEVILVPAMPGTGPEMLRDIVSDINRTQVAPDEVLADSVYFYSRKRDSLEWIC